MATLTRNAAQFGRLTALSGVYSLALATLIAAVTMTLWAMSRHRETAKDSSEGSQNRADDRAVAEDEPGLALAGGKEPEAPLPARPLRPFRRLTAVVVGSAAIGIAGLFIAISIDPGPPHPPATPYASGTPRAQDTSDAPGTPRATGTPPVSVTPRASPALGILNWQSRTEGSVTSSPVVADGAIYLSTDYNKVYALSTASGHVVWAVTAAGSVSSSPEAADGAVYVGTGSGVLGGTGAVYALSTADGHVLWHRLTGEEDGSAVAVAGGTVYAASYDGNVYALSTSDGYVLWRHATGDKFGNGLIVAGGTVYVASDNGLDALPAREQSRQAFLPGGADLGSVTSGST
jgi:PQQ-like domain